MSLNNYFLNKKQKEERNKEEQDYSVLLKQQKSRSVKNVQFKNHMLQRLENYCDNRFSDEYIQSMKSGAVPIAHPYNHQFRDREPKKEMDTSGGIYIKTFQVGKERAQTSQGKFIAGHLEDGVFDPRAPSKTDEFWLRVDDKTKESKPLRFGLGRRTENSRLQSVQQQQRAQMDHNPTDTKMIHHPAWKGDDKPKWMSSKTFALYPCMEQGFRSQPPWPQHPIRMEKEDHTYQDGFEVVGDLSRKRDKEREGKRPDFIPTVKRDVLASNINYSQSLRTMKQDHVLNVDPDHDSFSHNKRVPYYKSALLKTKSIDHTVPHHHSNNYKGIPLKDLRPATQGKLFIKSIAHYNQTLIPKRVAIIPVKEASPPRDQPTIHVDSTSPSPVRSSSLARIQEIPHPVGTPSQSLFDSKSRSKHDGFKRSSKQSSNLSQMDTQTLVDKYFTG